MLHCIHHHSIPYKIRLKRSITKTCLFKYIEYFTSKKKQKKISDIFHISAQNIDCWYSLELPWRGDSYKYPQSMFLSKDNKNNVYPCKPQFYVIKVWIKGVKNIQACFRNVRCVNIAPDKRGHFSYFGENVCCGYS